MTSFVKPTEPYRQGQRTLLREYYTAPEIYGEEMERIFCRRWLCAGRAAELANSGDFVVRTVAGESLIVVRGQDGVVRAFYNVCRHRGTRLCEEARGRFSETIQCPYHAWTYTLDGTLIGAPHMGDVQGFDKRDYPLHAVAVATWEGFLFLNLAREPEPFERAFAPVLERFSRFNLATLRSARRRRTAITCEWLFNPESFEQSGFDPDDAVRFWDETNRQDWDICELAQAGITSRAYEPGPYSPREGISAAWDREFLRALGHAR